MVRGATAADTAPIACPIITSTAVIGADCIFVARTPHAQRPAKPWRLRYLLCRSADLRNTRRPGSLKIPAATPSLLRRRAARNRTNRPAAERAVAASAYKLLSWKNTVGGMMAEPMPPYTVRDTVDKNGKTANERQSVSRGQ
jgi:hypothetical protein